MEREVSTTTDRAATSEPSGAAVSPPIAPWSLAADEVVAALATDLEHGLEPREARRRLRRFGANVLARARRRSDWQILRDQFASLIVALLGAAAIVAFLFEEHLEGVAIVGVIFINAAIGFVTERRAVRSMEALRELGRSRATVRRGASVVSVPASHLVPGDMVVIDAGDVLGADVRLVSASRLQADESTLTGESLPIDKDPSPVDGEAALSERRCMLYKGTAVTRGAGEGVVVSTGMATELGAISAMVAAAEPETTPLEKRLDRLGRRLIGLTLGIAALVAVAVASTERSLYFAVEIAIALAVATIPEGLPIVATVALARGMWRMARRNALVEKLAAVETLGSTTVILTDKTGTLTENRMTAVELDLARGRVRIEGTGLETAGQFLLEDRVLEPAATPDLADALRAGVLCNNATLHSSGDGAPEAIGDPTEIALLVAGAKAGFERAAFLHDWPEVAEIAFDSDAKRMATLHARQGVVMAAVKGAPETVVEVCDGVRTATGVELLGRDGRAAWLARADEMAGRGERVLALAGTEVEDAASFRYEGLTLLGLVGLFDPPRERVRAAIDACQDAGIRVVMVTGDHGATAWSVAAAVGLIDPAPGDPVDFVDARSLPQRDALGEQAARRVLAAPVIARASPGQKLELIELHQRAGAIVAMTGDGVNDAPALKKADIGVAMGIRGTQVAREAADMVLKDDELGTIVAAVAQGRAIVANIRKFVIYLMSCNVSEIFAVGVGVLLQGPLPILPLQILFLNLVTDVFPALALGVCEGSPALMREPPRDPREPILTSGHWRRLFIYGGVIAASVLGALSVAAHALGLGDREATTVAFMTLALAQIWHVFSMRNAASGWARNEITSNPWIWGALVLCIGLLVMAVHWAPLAGVLSTVNPGLSGWAVAGGFSLLPLAAGQAMLLGRSGRGSGAPVRGTEGAKAGGR